MEHRGFEFALRLGRGMALGCHWHPIHYHARSNPPSYMYKQKHRQVAVLLFVVEHRGFEFALRLGRGMALGCHWHPIHYHARSNPPSYMYKQKHRQRRCFYLWWSIGDSNP